MHFETSPQFYIKMELFNKRKDCEQPLKLLFCISLTIEDKVTLLCEITSFLNAHGTFAEHKNQNIFTYPGERSYSTWWTIWRDSTQGRFHYQVDT